MKSCVRVAMRALCCAICDPGTCHRCAAAQRWQVPGSQIAQHRARIATRTHDFIHQSCLLPNFPVMLTVMTQTELKRQIGLFDAIMLISGDMIGTGIFISTGVMAAQVPSPGGVLLVWLFGGLLALMGALSCAELSASLPYAGGDYNYIREAYGKLMGFLSGWSSFLVTFSGAIAFLAVIFNEYLSFFI